jgi:[NiFe] hydrogenase diaphorase moiety small subunit
MSRAPTGSNAATPPAPTDEQAFTLDGERIAIRPGDTLFQAASRAGRDIPHLCWHPDVTPSASCRLCTVLVDGRPVAACTTRAEPGRIVASETDDLREQRLRLLQMLFVEGNHFCPGCEKSGHCLLQAQAARAGMAELRFEELTPNRPVDASHLLVNSPSGRLGDSAIAADDRAVHICPVGALMPKRRGFAVPIGQRPFDTPEASS